jgi:hypothetical protein
MLLSSPKQNAFVADNSILVPTLKREFGLALTCHQMFSATVARNKDT